MAEVPPPGTSPGWDLVTFLVPPTGDPMADRDAVADLLDETIARRAAPGPRPADDVAHRAELVVLESEIRHLTAALEAYDRDSRAG